MPNKIINKIKSKSNKEKNGSVYLVDVDVAAAAVAVVADVVHSVVVDELDTREDAVGVQDVGEDVVNLGIQYSIKHFSVLNFLLENSWYVCSKNSVVITSQSSINKIGKS